MNEIKLIRCDTLIFVEEQRLLKNILKHRYSKKIDLICLF